MFAIYGTTYGAGDGSTTFKLPDFRNRAIWGSNGFGYIEAGLPNITGGIYSAQQNNGGSTEGALYFISRAGQGAENYGGGNSYNIGFDASKSNSIYGKAETVRPASVKVRVVTRYK